MKDLERWPPGQVLKKHKTQTVGRSLNKLAVFREVLRERKKPLHKTGPALLVLTLIM